MPIETFNISFESTQNKQHCDTKITCIWGKKKVMMIKNDNLFQVVCGFDIIVYLWLHRHSVTGQLVVYMILNGKGLTGCDHMGTVLFPF